MQSRPHSSQPNFLCVGVEKCGTTSLYDLLKQHPGIGLSSHKETHFFNSNWEKGLQWYQDKFSAVPNNCTAIGEITPSYHRFPEVIPRIKQTLGETVKIIIMLREPRRRAFSHYIHDFAEHQEVTDLVYKRYLTTTKYTPILENYFNAFGIENCLVLIFEEDFLPDQQLLMNKVCNFLKLAPHIITPIHSNPSCLPVACWSPPQDSLITLEGKTLLVPKNSLVIYTGKQKNTRILSRINKIEANALINKINNAVSFIPALKSSIVFEQNVQEDLSNVEKLIARHLDMWRLPLEDLHATYADQPVFLPL